MGTMNQATDSSDLKHAKIEAEVERLSQTLRFFKRTVLGLIGITLLALLIFAAIFSYHHIFNRTPVGFNPVPLAIRRSVRFPVYYPNPAQLPAGYRLDTASFTSSSLVVVYDVDYGHGQKLAFSVQQKPSRTAIQAFYANHLPLHTTISTAAGTATIGAIGSQTIASLPTNSQTWLIIAGPLNINQQQLSQVLHSIQSGNINK